MNIVKITNDSNFPLREIALQNKQTASNTKFEFHVV